MFLLRSLFLWASCAAILVVGASCKDGIDCPEGTAIRGVECVPLEGDGGSNDGGSNDGGLDSSADANRTDAEQDAGPPDLAPPCEPTGEVDVPDPDGLDADCDGIDGVLADGVVVAPSGAARPEGAVAATSTIALAIERAQADGLSYVFVAVGDYEESVSLAEGVHVVGGYDPLDGWSRDPAQHPIVRGASPALRAEGIDEETRVESMRFESLDATEPGASSYAAWVQDSSGVVLSDVVLAAGVGASGAAGTQPPPTRDGAPGLPGGPGAPNGHCGFPEGAVAPGGRGGAAGNAIFTCSRGGAGGAFSKATESARPGISGLYSNCTSQMNGGAAAPPEGDGGAGLGGQPRFTGPERDGSGAIAGAFSVAGYEPVGGEQGQNGMAGLGGGGGGSAGKEFCDLVGDFCFYYGASGGGGGGGGGVGGTPGTGGAGGGASVALFAWASTVTLVRVELVTAGGGAGGAGGDGGLGGRGGQGGEGGQGVVKRPCNSVTTGDGGRGGNGSAGAPGGGGGGGAGGPSVGIVLGEGASDVSEAVTFELGEGGAAGPGGGLDNDGSAGEATERWEVSL